MKKTYFTKSLLDVSDGVGLVAPVASSLKDLGPLHTRIAPSPTGYMHVGTLRTALINWALARASKGAFLLRMDDTDADRNQQSHIDLIHQSLSWAGLNFDSYFAQSDTASKVRYGQALDALRDAKLLTQDDRGVYMDARSFAPSGWLDFGAGWCKVSSQDVDILAKVPVTRPDGTVLYHFASVVDDLSTGINMICRGVDHISNTARQICIMRALAHAGFCSGDRVDQIRFAHVGLLMQGGKKLSKRQGDASLLQWRDQGISAKAMHSVLIRLGWGHPDSKWDQKYPIMDLDCITSNVLDGRLKSANPNFDPARLIWSQKACDQSAVKV